MKKSMLIGIRSLLAGVLIAVGPLPGTLAADLQVPSEYATIQDAVDAASSGDTIRIAPGDYYEQIAIVDKGNLTLAGEPGSVIHAYSGMTATLSSYGLGVVSIVGIVRSQVVLTNLTFDGAGLGDSYPNRLRGITFYGSGGRIENCTVKGFRGATQTDTRGIGVFNPLNLGTPVVNVSVLNSTFIDNTRSLVLYGDDQNVALLRTSFTIQGNAFIGLGAGATITNCGLFISAGAGGEVRGNTMTGFYQNSFAGFSAAIVHRFLGSRGFLPVQPVRYEGNTFSNNDDHLVLMAANESAVVNNIFHGTGPSGPRWGGLAVSGTNIVVANNDFSGMPTGNVLFGNDQTFDGATIKPASNVSLSANWFCGVPTPVSILSGANAIQDQGTQTCPFRPVLQSIAIKGSSASVAVRSWHGQPVVLETSTDLQNWSPIYTNAMALPRIEYGHGTGAADPHRFFRAFQP